MKNGKSLVTTIIAALVIFLPAVQDAFGPVGTIVIGAFSMLLVAFFKTYYDSANGVWLFAAMKPTLLIANLAGFVITAIALIKDYMASNGVEISSPVALALTKAVIILNAVILTINELPFILGKKE